MNRSPPKYKLQLNPKVKLAKNRPVTLEEVIRGTNSYTMIKSPGFDNSSSELLRNGGQI